MQVNPKIKMCLSLVIAAIMIGMPFYVMYTSVIVSDTGITTEDILAQTLGETGTVELNMMEDCNRLLSLDDYFPAGWDEIYASRQSEVTILINGDTALLEPSLNWYGHEDVTIEAKYLLTNGLTDPSPVPPPVDPGFSDLPNSAPAPPSIPPQDPDPVIGDYYVTVSMVFSLDVAPVNDPPVVINYLPKVFQLTTNSDFQVWDIFSLNDIFQDVDSKLTFTYGGGDSIASPIIVNNELYSVRSNSQLGDGMFSIVASDQEDSVRYDFFVQVVPRESYSMYEDTVMTEPLSDFLNSDVDDYEIIDSGHISATPIDVWGEDTTVNLAPESDWFGSDSIAFRTITEPTAIPVPPSNIIFDNSVDTTQVIIPKYATRYGYYECDVSVINVNDPPQVNSESPYKIGMTANTDFMLGAPLKLSAIFNDIDSSLTYSWSMENGLAAPNIRNAEITEISTYGQVGEDTMTVFATDGEYAAQYSIPLTVMPRVDIGMNEDTTGAIDLESYVDPETQNYTIAAPEHIKVDNDMLEPEQDWNGMEILELSTYPIPYGINPPEEPIALSAPPGSSVNPPQTYTMEYGCYEFDIDVASVNDAPTMQPAPAISMNEDQTLADALSLDDYFQDIDSTLQFQVSSANPMINAALDAGSQVDIAPAADWFGEDTITLTATDGEYTVSQNIGVKILPVNDPPKASGDTEPIMLDEDTNTTVQLDAYMSDVDNALWFSCLLDNENATVELNETTWTATVAPAENWNGELNMTIYGSDGEYQLARNLTLNVAAVNDPPVMASPGPVSLDEDSSIAVDMDAMFSDVDSSLTYMAYSETGALSVMASGAQLTLAPVGSDWNGQDTVRLVASDGQYTVETEMCVSVIPVNDAPQFRASQQDFSTDEDMDITIAVGDMFRDVDGDALAYTIQDGNGIESELDDSGEMLTVHPEADWNGETKLNIIASDGELTASTELDIRVNPVDDAPLQTGDIVPLILKSGDTFTIDLTDYFSDVEAQELHFQVLGAEGITVEKTDTNGVFQITVPKDWQGTEKLSISVSDGTNTVENSMFVSATMPQMVQQSTTLPATGFTQSLFWSAVTAVVCFAGFVSYNTMRQPRIKGRDNIL